MGAKASRWLATLDLTKPVDGATVELIWDEYDQNHTGYLEGDEVDRLLKHWCAIHRVSNFDQVRNEFWERFDLNKEGRIAKVNLLGGAACMDKDGEKDRTSGEKEDHKLEEFKKSRGSLPGVLSLRKKSSDTVAAGLIDPPANQPSGAPRGSLFGLRNSGGLEAAQSQGSLFGPRNGEAGHDLPPPPRTPLFGRRTSSEQVTSTEHRRSLFDLNKSRGGAASESATGLIVSPSGRASSSPVLTSEQKINSASGNTHTSNNNVNNNNGNNSNSNNNNFTNHIPELNLRGPRASLPANSLPPRRATTRRSLPNPTLAKVFSFLHDSSNNTATTSTTRADSSKAPAVSSLNPQRGTSPNPQRGTSPNPQRGTSPFRVFDLLTSRQPSTPLVLITAPTKPLPPAAQVQVANAGMNETKEDPLFSADSSSFPSYLNPEDCIDKELLRAMLSASVPDFVLELELGRLHAHNVFTLADAHRLSLSELEAILRPSLARGLHEFLHERRTSLSSPTLTPYRNSPNHSRSSQFREKLQGRTSISWGSLSRSDKDNSNPLDLLEPPARFRPSKRFVFTAPTLSGDDLVLNSPAPAREGSESKRFSI